MSFVATQIEIKIRLLCDHTPATRQVGRKYFAIFHFQSALPLLLRDFRLIYLSDVRDFRLIYLSD